MGNIYTFTTGLIARTSKVMVFRVRDIFLTRGHDNITDQPTYYVNMEHKPSASMISLSLSYKINNFKRKPDMNKGDGGDMEMQF